MNSADTIKKRKVEYQEDDMAQMTAASKGGLSDIIAQMRSEMNDMKNTHLMSQSRIDELENKCEVLETKCSSLKRSVSILTKEQTWEYSAPVIPRSYWVQQGLENEHINEMQQFIISIKSLTCKLRSGVDVPTEISLDSDERVVFHDAAFLPHWKEFANALQLYQADDSSHELTFLHVELAPPVIDLLLPVLTSKTIFNKLCWDDNYFMNIHEGIELLVKTMNANPWLVDLDLTDNTTDSEEDVHHLKDAIISQPSIHTIRLHNLCGESVNGYNLLCSLLASNKSFIHISLEGNNIQTGGDTTIPDYIGTNPPLKRLWLADNKLNDNDIQLIARALKLNTNLQHLRLGDNCITFEGNNALIKVAYDPTSFKSLVECNHTCSIDRESVRQRIPVVYSTLEYCPQKIMRSKIYHLLSERNKEGSNAHYLNLELDDEEDDVSMKLVPRVLECVHSYHRAANGLLSSDGYREKYNPVPPFSIMFEILRSWKVPEL